MITYNEVDPAPVKIQSRKMSFGRADHAGSSVGRNGLSNAAVINIPGDARESIAFGRKSPHRMRPGEISPSPGTG